MRNRHGFVLPVAIISVTLATALGGALVTAAWRSSTSARTTWFGERALHAAESALATAALTWTPASLSNMAVGARDSISISPAPGITTRVVAIRTSASTLLLTAEATLTSGTGTLARRQLSRVVELDASPFALPASVTSLGLTNIDAGAVIDASGTAGNRESTCESPGDSASHPGIAVSTPGAIDSAQIFGSPGTIPLAAPGELRDRIINRIDASDIPVQLVPTLTSINPETNGVSCTGLSGEPRRGPLALTACTGHWPVRRLSSSNGTVALTSSRHQGALLIDGDLVLDGLLELRGLLVVRGTLDTRNGTLDGTGAVVALHHIGGTTHIGATTTIRFSRCALLRAVTPLATSGTSPVLQWAERH